MQGMTLRRARNRKAGASGLLATLLVLCTADAAQAFRCEPNRGLSAIESADVVFAGRVHVIDDRKDKGRIATLSITKVWKGDVASLLTLPGDGYMTPYFEPQNLYIVFARRMPDGHLFVSSCDVVHSTDLDWDATMDLLAHYPADAD